jgi:hypothetical protein
MGQELAMRLQAWTIAHGMKATVCSYFDWEFYSDALESFVDFVIEAMMPELANYEVDV